MKVKGNRTRGNPNNIQTKPGIKTGGTQKRN